MSRNFPNFLAAYFSYARDSFCPDPFHFWTGVSIVAGALERKVWIKRSPTLWYYPNLYVLLVSHPGIGKSSAGNAGVHGLLRQFKDIHFIPSQVTEAKFIDIMSSQSNFHIGTQQFFQSAGYFYASEASNSLKNIYGDFIACLTDFYDCPPIWEKATKKDDRVTLSNVCFNMLAGCTFDYLGKLITDENIMGGFASRLLYVIYDEKVVRNPKWEDSVHDEATRKALLHDLGEIHKMAGPFTAEDSFKGAFIEWFKKHDEERMLIQSEKIQSLMARKSTNLLKLCMICAASEDSDRILREVHFHRALELLEDVEKGIPRMLRMTQAQQGVDTVQKSLIMAIMNAFGEERENGISLGELTTKVANQGYEIDRLKRTLGMMIEGKQIAQFHKEGRNFLKLNIRPEDYL